MREMPLDTRLWCSARADGVEGQADIAHGLHRLLSLRGERQQFDAANPVRVKSNLRSRFNVIWVVQSCCEKYFASRIPQISGAFRAVSHPQRGTLRGRHGRWERDAMDAAVSTDE
jgi:hypothetical protein